MEQLKELISLINPEKILNIAGDYAIYVLFLIIFAETGLMIGFFLPGDSLLFLTGLYCATGHIPNPLWVILTALTLAAIVGDQVGYMIGKKLGKTLFTREESLLFKPKYIQQTKEFYDRHGGKTIMIGRFVPIVRTFAPVVAGVAGLEYRKFVGFNVIGGIVWIVSMTCLGYFIGNEVPKSYIKYITLAIIIISVIPIINTYLKERKLAKSNITKN